MCVCVCVCVSSAYYTSQYMYMYVCENVYSHKTPTIVLDHEAWSRRARVCFPSSLKHGGCKSIQAVYISFDSLKLARLLCKQHAKLEQKKNCIPNSCSHPVHTSLEPHVCLVQASFVFCSNQLSLLYSPFIAYIYIPYASKKSPE